MGDLESRRPSSGGGLFTFGHTERTLFICGSERSLAAALVSVEELDACFVAKDRDGQKLAYVPGPAPQAKLQF
jgi:hypothetical protein